MDITLSLPGHRLHEYLLVIDPHEELRHKIEKCRQQLTEKYHILQPQTGRPHITLVRFTANPMMEEKIINRLQLIAMAEKPFVVELQDFGSYPMHAIFIKIVNQPRVLQLIKNLKQARRLMKAAGDDPHFLQDPQIALAGRLPKDKYLELMKEYLHKKFTGRFYADAMLLLRRPKNEKRYQIVRRFEFECLPVTTAQGVLF
ncbi:MAG: 2'-5' RNA ligase family protein [Chitinophagaceae bacterium]|nr:2'-5' RNA ligase family protein [Chitinophagaceae bacterium]MBK9532990.1 2'-5' RNA ligase family protein [Chitinophagaceae bacterium]